MIENWQEQGPGEECGVFGIYAPGRDVARLTFFGLYALQHRGQESAGIATSDGQMAYIHKGMGLVTQVFNEDNLSPLQGHIAVGHNRYSTTGTSHLRKHPTLPHRNHLWPAWSSPQRQPDQRPEVTKIPA